MSESTGKAVFLSYASQDAEAAQRICDALRAVGIEVWFDQNELVGGDAWDAKIRNQIGSCALFIPIVSVNTQARKEGYFRLEWKLAEDRSHLMAKGVPFIVPVSVDATSERGALVPDAFTAVQWTKLPGGEATPMFVARVDKLLGASSALAARPVSVSTPPSTPALAAKSGLPLWVTAALGVVVLGLVAAIALRPSAKETPAAPATAEPVTEAKVASVAATASPVADQSVAVLAFANMSADKDTDYFSDGVSEEILDALANNPALRVAARTSSFSFKGKNATAGEIGRALNVARVIEGSVRKAGNKVRITVQLINAADGYHAWSETFDRDLTDIFAVQSEIAAKVAQKLSGGSAASVASPAPTKNLAAYDAYLRGRAAQTKGNSPAVLDEATHNYEEAVRLDPGYAMAWARLAQVYVKTWSYSDRTDELANKARTAAATAARLNPNLPEAHVALAAIHHEIDYDFDAAQRELDLVERLRPNDAEVPAARTALEFARGNWGERFVALALLAAERDPQNASTASGMGEMLAGIGKFYEADRLFDRAWAGQAFPAPLRFKARAMVAWTGDVTAAFVLLETCPERVRNENFYQTLAEVTALRGDAVATIAANDQSRTAARRDQPNYARRNIEVMATYRMGWHHTRLGNLARAEELYTGALALAEKLAGEFPQEPAPRFNVALIQARRGQKTAALAAAEEAMRLATRTHDAGQLAGARRTHAEVLAALGLTEAAIAELRAVHEMGYGFGYSLRVGLEWEPLRGDAIFQQLMKEAEARADAQPRSKK